MLMCLHPPPSPPPRWNRLAVFVSDDFVDMTGYNREEINGINCRFLQVTSSNACLLILKSFVFRCPSRFPFSPCGRLLMPLLTVQSDAAPSFCMYRYFIFFSFHSFFIFLLRSHFFFFWNASRLRILAEGLAKPVVTGSVRSVIDDSGTCLQFLKLTGLSFHSTPPSARPPAHRWFMGMVSTTGTVL